MPPLPARRIGLPPRRHRKHYTVSASVLQKNYPAAPLISPPLILESSALDKPRVSKLRLDDPPSYYARLLADQTATQTPAWQAMEQAVKELGEQSFGGPRGFAALVQGGQF